MCTHLGTTQPVMPKGRVKETNPEPRKPTVTLGQDWQSQAKIVHPRNSVANADVYLVQVGDRELLAKTYANNPAWARLLLGRWGLSREYRAMTELDTLPGVPQVHGVHAGHTLLMDYVADGTPLVARRELTPDRYPPLAFFHRLRELTHEMHRRGVAHGDMRRTNILRTKDNQPVLIDFATAVRWQRFNPLARILFHALRRTDEFGVGKLQMSFYPDSLSEDEKQRILRKPWYLALGRFLRKRVYRKWIKQRRWRKRIRAWCQTSCKQKD